MQSKENQGHPAGFLGKREGETEEQRTGRIELTVNLLMINEKKMVTILTAQAVKISEQQRAIDYLMSGYSSKSEEGGHITIH